MSSCVSFKFGKIIMRVCTISCTYMCLCVCAGMQMVRWRWSTHMVTRAAVASTEKPSSISFAFTKIVRLPAACVSTSEVAVDTLELLILLFFKANLSWSTSESRTAPTTFHTRHLWLVRNTSHTVFAASNRATKTLTCLPLTNKVVRSN